MTRIYIAGPMTGLPESNYPAFDRAARQLRELGHEVENPAENAPPACGTWEGWMRLALRQLVTCEAIALLPGWKRSRGAKVEKIIADALNLKTLYLADQKPKCEGRAKGGLARAAKLTAEQRSEIARKGAQARWGAAA